MRTVRVARSFAASTPVAEALWYDTGRWAEWVDGLEGVTEVSADWPPATAPTAWR